MIDANANGCAAQFASAQSSAGVWISGLSSNLLSKLGAANTLADIPARDNPLRYDTLESWNVANSTFAKRDEGVHFDKDVFGRYHTLLLAPSCPQLPSHYSSLLGIP